MSRVVKASIKYGLKTMNLGQAARDPESWDKFWFEMKVKMRANKGPLVTTLAFWVAGFMYYYWVVEADQTFYNIAMVTTGIRSPAVKTDFSNLYQLAWPIFLEVIVFGFLSTALLGQFNPKSLGKLQAANRTNHTLVIGYNHLGKRIVAFLRKHKQPYVLVEDSESAVSELLANQEPVVISDAGRSFVVSDKLQQSLVACFHIRKANAKCDIFMQTFQDSEFEALFAEELRIFAFSTSQWAVDSVADSMDNAGAAWGDVAIFGVGKLSTRLAAFFAEEGRTVHIIDADADPRCFEGCDNVQVHSIPDPWNRHAFVVQALGGMEKVTHMFLTWHTHADLLRMAILVHEKHPHINLYVRVFDDTMAEIISNMGGKVFSTSAYAFSVLRAIVPRTSGIAAHIADKPVSGTGKSGATTAVAVPNELEKQQDDALSRSMKKDPSLLQFRVHTTPSSSRSSDPSPAATPRGSDRQEEEKPTRATIAGPSFSSVSLGLEEKSLSTGFGGTVAADLPVHGTPRTSTLENLDDASGSPLVSPSSHAPGSPRLEASSSTPDPSPTSPRLKETHSLSGKDAARERRKSTRGAAGLRVSLLEWEAYRPEDLAESASGKERKPVFSPNGPLAKRKSVLLVQQPFAMCRLNDPQTGMCTLDEDEEVDATASGTMPDMKRALSED